MLTKGVLQELRKSREESADLKEKWVLAQEDAYRGREESLAIQRDLCAKVDRMMDMFESLSRHTSRTLSVPISEFVKLTALV